MEQDQKFYWLKLKKNKAKSGKTYWTGNFSYAIDIIGFEKDDGTMTVWFSPKDMDKVKQAGQERQQSVPPPQRPPPPPKQQYVDHTRALPPPQEDQAPWPEDEPPF